MNDTRLPEPAPTQRQTGRALIFPLVAVALAVASGVAGTQMARWLRGPDVTIPNGQAAAASFPNRILTGWKKPDLALVVSGQQNGYLLPCGCSEPQIGGLERRYNFIQMIRAAGWPYVAVDVGDIPQRHGPAGLPNQQGLIKYIYSMKALKEMNYTAVGIGESEANLGLFNVLAEYALNEKQPRVVTGNLIDPEKNFPEMTRNWVPVEPPATGIKVGVTGVVGATVASRLKEITNGDPTIRFERTDHALTNVLNDMAANGVHLPILLYQGPVTRNAGKKPYTEAMACAEAFPQFPVIVCLTDEDQPPARPVEVTTRTGSKSLVVTLGKKGKFVGVVGIYRTGKASQPLEYRYECVEMTPDFKTPPDKQKGHPISELMEAYTRELKDKRYLEKYGQVRHALQVMPKVPGLRRDAEVKFVGSEVCKRCHEEAYDIWKKSPHSHAYQTLVDARRPGNRQYDPECIVCHTVGFGHVSGFVNESSTPKLKDVGCESCHGPSSVHVLNPNDEEWHKRINPWKYLPPERREDATDQFCQKCHDQDNDVTWIHGGFKRKWPKIAHPTPKPAE